jgi:hypothetical protein
LNELVIRGAQISVPSPFAAELHPGGPLCGNDPEDVRQARQAGAAALACEEIDNQASVTVTGGAGTTFGRWTGGTITIGNGNLTFAGGNTRLGRRPIDHPSAVRVGVDGRKSTEVGSFRFVSRAVGH